MSKVHYVLTVFIHREAICWRKDTQNFGNIKIYCRYFANGAAGADGRCGGILPPGGAATAGGAAAICPAFAYTSSETIILSFVGDHVGDVSEIKLTDRQLKILNLIKASPSITAKQVSETLSVSQRTIERAVPRNTPWWMEGAGDFAAGSAATAGGAAGIEIFLHFLAIKFGFMSITY